MIRQYSRDWLVLTVSVLILSNVSFGFRTISSPKSTPRSLREVIQVYPPPLSPKDLNGSISCSFTLMEHVFAQSAGKPYVGTLYASQFISDSKQEHTNLCAVISGMLQSLTSVWC